MPRLNIGCWTHILPGWVNADIIPMGNGVVQMDASKPWPWEDNTFDQIWASHIAEHVLDKMHFIREMYRVSKPGALIQLRIPPHTWSEFWRDPTHRSCWNEHSFDHFLVGNPDHKPPYLEGVFIEFALIRFDRSCESEYHWWLKVRKKDVEDGYLPEVADHPELVLPY